MHTSGGSLEVLRDPDVLEPGQGRLSQGWGRVLVKLVPKRSILQNVAVLGSALLVCLVAAELFFRLWPQFLNEEAALRLHWRELVADARDQAWAVPDPHIGFLYRPNLSGRISRHELDFNFTTDENGFRNPSPWPEQADIVVVGDSIAFSYGVDDEQAWVRLVANALPELEIINLGLVGAAPEQYLRVLEAFGLGLSPKLALFVLFPANDLTDNDSFRRWLAAGTDVPYKEWRITGGREPAHWRRLLEGSYLVTFLRGVRRSLTSPVAARTIELRDGGRVQLVPGLSDAENARPGHPVFELVVDTIDEARAVSNRRGSDFLVLLMPAKEDVYLPVAAEPAPRVIESLKTALRERGIESLDLTPHFRAHARDFPPLFYEVDGHPNEEGYRLIARAVTEHLRKHGRTYGLWD
jgi:lysophospholipase L1-like esterase